MPETNYKALDSVLSQIDREKLPQVILIYGEEMLYKNALKRCTDALLPGADKQLNYDPIDGIPDNIGLAIERANTFSLLPGIRIIGFLNADLFYSKQNEGALIEKAAEALGKDDLKKASSYMLNVLSMGNLSLEDVSGGNASTHLKLPEGLGPEGWVERIVAYCLENHLSVPRAGSAKESLILALEKGFPKSNYLMITTEIVDKRQRLYKTIKDKGLVIDCSVPKGERRADKAVQESVLQERAREVLSASGKTLGRDAFMALSEMTGFDLRTFSNNLEKLIDYVQDRREIRPEDIASALDRTKKDPVYELTNAISDRSVEKSLFFLSSLLSGDMHPLQIVAAVTNTMRKLLVARDFIESPAGKPWHAGCQYNEFRASVMPAIQAYDKSLADMLTDWQSGQSGSISGGDGGEKKPANKKTIKTDLLLAANPNNPYPVYQNLRKSERFSREELLNAIRLLADADRRMKSTGQDPVLVAEDTIIKICLPQQ